MDEWPDEMLKAVIASPAQYDWTCRSLAEKVLALRARVGELETTFAYNARLRAECVGALTNVGEYCLVAPDDPTGPNEVGRKIHKIADERDAALSSLAAATKRAEEAEGENRELRKQLPDGMQHCTIIYRGCSLGHGWLTATNWTDFPCPTCKSDALKNRWHQSDDHNTTLTTESAHLRSLLERAAEMIHVAITDGETVYPDDARALLAEMREKEIR